MIYAAFRAWKTLRRYFISLPSKTAFYCVTKSREPTTNESDMFSALACTLFVSVDDKLVSILPYHRKAKAFGGFLCGLWCPKPNRNPAQRLRYGEEEQQNERALTFKKVGASDMTLAPTWSR